MVPARLVAVNPEINPAEDPIGIAILLHPHPDYGGNRHHPFIDGLHRRLPGSGVSTVRFDFTSGDVTAARREALEAVEAAGAHWPGKPVVLVGYSFGAATAAGVSAASVAGWFLLAPPEVMLADATIGDMAGPKSVHVPERDQYSSPAAVRAAVAGWTETTVSVVPGVDHFLGAVEPMVVVAAEWVVDCLSA